MSTEFLEQMKEIQNHLIFYIDNLKNSDVYFKYLIKLFFNYSIWDNPYEFKILLCFICSISNNHYRTPDFYSKIERILHFLKEDIKDSFSNSEIFKIFKSNKRILLFLIEDQILNIDKSIALKMLQSKYKDANYDEYFSSEIQSFVSIEKNEEKEIYINFNKKRKIGENHEPICTYIQNDLISDFIAFINRTNLSLKTKIKKSIFETNSFLIDKEPTLIEYAAFFGSIQIFKYLIFHGVKLTPSIWMYSIHGKNAEIIHTLEDNNIEPEDETFEKCLEEAVKCNHNQIANYIQNNLLMRKIESKNEKIKILDSTLNEKIAFACFRSFNFDFFPSNFENKIMFYNEEFHHGMRSNKKEIIYLLLSFLEVEIEPQLAQISIDLSQTGNKLFDGRIELTQLTNNPYEKANVFNKSIYNCSSLNHLIISTTIKTKAELNLNDETFELKNIIYSSKLSIQTINTNLFKGCSKLTQITIPSSVTSIDERAFEGCTSLVQITLPETIQYIGDSAFYNCSSLSQIKIPSLLTSIEPYTFYGCSSLKEVTIPSNVTKIGDSSFRSCSLLSQVKIPSSVTLIESYAFYGCNSICEIEIPSSVTKIGDCAFKRCSSLSQFTIPSFVDKIESYTFYGCSSLKEITIPTSVKKIGNFAFRGCTSLTQISIPSSVTEIESNAFFVCSSLSKISIPSSIESIESFTFSGCISLKEVEIPSSVKSIQDDAFFKCSSLTQISIPSSVTKIESYTFYGCTSLKEILIPSSVTKIGNSAFRGCSSLTKIEIPSSVTEIEDHVFYDCISLKDVSIPSSVTLIDHHAFYGCSSLIEISIPISVKKIGDDSFIRCSSLRKIYIPEAVNIDNIGIEYDVIVKKI